MADTIRVVCVHCGTAARQPREAYEAGERIQCRLCGRDMEPEEAE